MRKLGKARLHTCTGQGQRRAEHAARWDSVGPKYSVRGACAHVSRRWPIVDTLVQCSARQTEPATRAIQ